MSNWQLPEVFIDQYRAACKLAATSDKAFANFRQDPHIACVIENTNKEWADKALQKMGYVPLFDYVMGQVGFTPTMIRYAYTLHLIETMVPSIYDLQKIVEIGGGYGGMCRVIRENGGLHQYTIFDLPEVVELQQRYLAQYEIFPTLLTDIPSHYSGADLCISWCAWSELSYDLRVEYSEKVISKCQHFFICSNYNKEEDREILARFFPDIKEYSDELVQSVLYA